MILLKRTIGRTVGPPGTKQRVEYLELPEELWERKKANFLRSGFQMATKEETERYAAEKGYVIDADEQE